MIKCPQCGTENLDGALFCDECGASLTDVQPEAGAPAGTAEAPAGQEAEVAPAEVAPAEVAERSCPSCGHKNPPDAQFCENCGAKIAEEAPAPVEPAPAEAAPAEAPPAPEAVEAPPVTVPAAKLITADGTEIALDFSSKEELLVGRADPVSRVFPDVDLTPHGGFEAGVSRRHCIIRKSGDQFTVEDLESTNGTRINGQFIAPKSPQPINDGDEIMLGALALKFQVVLQE